MLCSLNLLDGCDPLLAARICVLGTTVKEFGGLLANHGLRCLRDELLAVSGA